MTLTYDLHLVHSRPVLWRPWLLTNQDSRPVSLRSKLICVSFPLNYTNYSPACAIRA